MLKPSRSLVSFYLDPPACCALITSLYFCVNNITVGTFAMSFGLVNSFIQGGNSIFLLEVKDTNKEQTINSKRLNHVVT